MDILFLALILVVILFTATTIYDIFPNVSRCMFLIFILIGIWLCAALSNHKQEEKFLKKEPILLQGEVAFAIYKNNIINCSKDFKKQFKAGDSIYVFIEIDSWSYGIKWKGGDNVYKVEK